MALEVIGAGLGRTGTESLKLALERLGLGPCCHMTELGPRGLFDAWHEELRSGRPNWDRLFDQFRSTTDWPAATYWRELADHYPDAKVILTVRDASAWFDSTQKTIFSDETDRAVPPIMRAMADIAVFAMFDHDLHDRERCIAVFERHNRAVRETIPPERLLVFEVSDGWEPLCAFLDLPVPDEPFPRANDQAAFARHLETGLG